MVCRTGSSLSSWKIDGGNNNNNNKRAVKAIHGRKQDSPSHVSVRGPYHEAVDGAKDAAGADVVNQRPNNRLETRRVKRAVKHRHWPHRPDFLKRVNHWPRGAGAGARGVVG